MSRPLVVCACGAVWEEDACESEAERRFMYSILTLHTGDVVEVQDCPSCEPYEWGGHDDEPPERLHCPPD